MSALPSIPQVIQIGDVCVYLSSNNNSSGALFGRKLASPTSPVTIGECTDALRFRYEGDPTDTTLRGTADYVLWLCGMYGLQAQNIISGSGGGSVTPVTPNIPSPIQFIVNTSTSFMVNGQSSIYIPSFQGYNLLFTRGGIPQSTINTEPTFYTWDKTSGFFSISPAAVTSELFQIYAI